MQSIQFGNLDMMLMLSGLKIPNNLPSANQAASCKLKTYLSDSTCPYSLNETYDYNGFEWGHQQLFDSQNRAECKLNNQKPMPFLQILWFSKIKKFKITTFLTVFYMVLWLGIFRLLSLFMLCWPYRNGRFASLFSSICKSRYAKNIRLKFTEIKKEVYTS